MEKIVTNPENFGQAAMEPSPRNLLAVAATSINDLPLLAMERIFEELDSITRKKIEGVCKEWKEIIRGTRKFRTHLKFELSSHVFPIAHPHVCYNDMISKLGHLVKPDLKVLHFKPSKLPDVNLDSVDFFENMKGNLLQFFLMGFRHAGIDLSKVEIVISDSTVDCAFSTVSGMAADLPNIMKIRIIRSNIAAFGWLRRSMMYVEELQAENLDELPQQLLKLFRSENGPLTKKQSAAMDRLKRRCTRDAVPDIEEIRSIAAVLKRVTYVDGYDWIAVLTAIANGGHVSKHTADYLADLAF